LIVVSESGKGKFSADIRPEVIDEALQSVAKPAAERTLHAVAEGASAAGSEETPLSTPSEIDEVRSQLALSQEKGRETMARLQEVHERMLRAVADLENYRKRTQKEKEQMQKFGAEKILADFLPVMDNLDRALDHSNGAADFTSLMRGVAMTRKLFEDTLAKYGVQPIFALGQAFDPHLHEAMQHVESSELPANQVVAEMVAGYTLNGRLLRPALVVVAKKPNPGEALDEQSHRD